MDGIYNTSPHGPARDPVFTRPVAILPGAQGTPGLAVQGDGDTGLFAPAPDTLAVVTGGHEVARFSAGTGATSGLQVQAGTTLVALRPQGSETNVGLQLEAKGQSVVQFATRGGIGARVQNAVDNAVNYLTFSGNAGANSPYIGTGGQAANLDVWLQPKGNGVLRLNYAFSSAITPSSFTADRWIMLKDINANSYYVPCRSTPW